MKLSTSLVAVKKITSTRARSIFVEDELEQAAQSILESEGVINPIVVRRTSLQSFEVVDGDFEYYAATRAREIDPRKGEMIGVFIIEPENEDTLTKQVQLFRQQKLDSSPTIASDSKDIEKFLLNLESRFEKITNQLFEKATANVKLENENKELRKQIADKSELLEVFNASSNVDILSKALNAVFNSKKVSHLLEIIQNERAQEQFKSLNDVVQRVKVIHGKRKIKGISSEKMLEIVDWWSKK